MVKIFALTRGGHAPRPFGQPDGCPIPLSCGIALGLEPRLNVKCGFNWAGKIELFSKASFLLTTTTIPSFQQPAGFLLFDKFVFCIPVAYGPGCIIIIGAALFVIVVFPYFFKESLVKPLSALLDGVKKVNEGALEVVVPVKVEDEIGYLSNSFNSMVQSIQDAREKLKNALDHQVKLTESYSYFVPKEFLQFLEKESVIDIKLGDNVQKEMSILFSDIRSFTRLSEKMSPQENFNFINSCLSRIGPVVRDNNGFIDKYIGDAVMALFPYKAEDAVKAAVDMQKVIRTYNQHRDKAGYEPIKIGIGVNAGIMMLGTIGEEKRMEGTVISDAVNLASRLEGLTKMYGASVLVSSKTLEGIENRLDFHYRFLDRVQVKGKKKWVEIYEIFDSDPADLVEMKLKTKPDFENGIMLYQDHKFDEALDCFKKVLETNRRDKTAGLYVKWCERIQQYGLPEGWEGITAMDQK